MRKAFIIAILIFSFAVIASAQEFEAPAAPEKIASWLDYASYKIDNYPDFALVEFYYGVLRHELTFEDFDSVYEATINVWVEIFDENGTVVDTLQKMIATRVNSPTELSKHSFKIIDALQALMRPGIYSVKLRVEDVNSRLDDQPFTGKFGERQIKVEIPNFSDTSKVSLSSVELSYKIEMLPKVDTLDINPLHKSSRNVVPNPTGIFLNADSLMYFYAEIYNLKFGPKINRNYSVHYMINDASGTTVADYGTRQYLKPGTSAVVSSAIDISDLPEGRFAFVLEVQDDENGSIIQTSKGFNLLYRTSELAPAVSEEQFSEDDAELMEKIVRTYGTDQERSLYKNADLEGKKEVLKMFWSRRDPTPDTRYNEFKEEAFRRFAYANQKFSVNLVNKTDGWKTDRGRIYMRYGAPDDIEYHPSSPEIEPYERWVYYSYGKQGTIYFIFVDETGYGNYVLKHSTAQGEVVDYDWEEKVQKSDPFNTGF
jgi:GWxTD domain-containing protein